MSVVEEWLTVQYPYEDCHLRVHTMAIRRTPAAREEDVGAVFRYSMSKSHGGRTSCPMNVQMLVNKWGQFVRRMLRSFPSR